jgi:hypothetical protein
VVPLASAEIVNEWAENRDLIADHVDICKFRGPDDPKYKDLKAILRRYFDEIASEAAVIADGNDTVSDEAAVAVSSFHS